MPVGAASTGLPVRQVLRPYRGRSGEYTIDCCALRGPAIITRQDSHPRGRAGLGCPRVRPAAGRRPMEDHVLLAPWGPRDVAAALVAAVLLIVIVLGGVIGLVLLL